MGVKSGVGAAMAVAARRAKTELIVNCMFIGCLSECALTIEKGEKSVVKEISCFDWLVLLLVV
jgi:hypothetical protein